MGNAIRNHWQSALAIAGFLFILGTIGRMEMEWETEKETRVATMHGNQTWEVAR